MAMRVAAGGRTRAGEGAPAEPSGALFLRLCLAFYLLAIGLGLVLRFFFVSPQLFAGWPLRALVVSNAVHAHSHTLYFGWGALGVFALVFAALRAEGRGPRRLLACIALLSAATFVSFLQGGYSLPSVVLSSLSLCIWAWGLVAFWRAARGEAGGGVPFFRAGMVYLLLASAAAVTRVVFIVVKAPQLYGLLAVYGFLNSFAWFFVFSVLGLLVHAATRLGISLDEGLLRWQLRLAFPLAWLTFPLGVAGGDQGALGLGARAASLALLLPAALGAIALWRARSTGGGGTGPFRWLAFWLALEALLSLAGGLGLATAAVQSRHLAILYLHVLLVGFVSFALMIAVQAGLGLRVGRASWLHNLGLLVMVAGLGLAGLPVFSASVPLLQALPDSLPRIGLIAAAAGGVSIFAAGCLWAAAAWRGRARESVEAQREVA